MKKLVCCLVVAALSVGFFAAFGSAQEKTQEQREKDIMIANVIALRNKETRIAVLQQLLNEELNSLRQVQAVFCDQYKLDPEKFRAGQYIYDDKSGTFVERQPVATEEVTAATEEKKE